MTVYELIQRIAKYPPDTVIRQGVDWTADFIIDDWMDIEKPEDRCLILSTEHSSNGRMVTPASPVPFPRETAILYWHERNRQELLGKIAS